MSLKVVDFPKQEEEKGIDPEILQRVKDKTAELVKAAEEGRLTQVLLQFEAEEDEIEGVPEDAQAVSTTMMFWNDGGSFDQIIGFAARLKFRLLAIAEGNAQEVPPGAV